ncbi:general secretion pathway protein GspK [Brevundimonas sp.]|uniref:general secretion pathway protein GspK n=1 Tax=Brevundimonas sp. TaxID=1871086 RepID=UPI003561B0D9
MTGSARRGRREGMILLNVLIVVAICAAAVTVMIVAQDIEVQRSTRLHQASQAQVYGRAGELSAVVALRRDGLTSPEIDGLTEPWAQIGQRTIAIPGGEFALDVSDEQAFFNVNSVAGGDPVAASVLLRIGATAGVSRETLSTIALSLALVGPMRDDGPLRTAGVDPADLQRLAPWVTFLPPEATLNVNTASPEMIAIVLNDPALARSVVDQRSRAALTPEAVLAFGAPRLVGARSDHYRVETVVRVGDVRRRTVSRIERSIGPLGVEVRVISRRRSHSA